MSYDFASAKITVDFTCECGKVAHLTGWFPDGTVDSFVVTCPELFDDLQLTQTDITALAAACDNILDKLPDLPDD